MKTSSTVTKPTFAPRAVVIEFQSQAELDAFAALMAYTVQFPEHIYRSGGSHGDRLRSEGFGREDLSRMMQAIRNETIKLGASYV